MQVIGIQIFTVVFSLLMIYITYICYKRKYFGIYGLISWTAIFMAIIGTSLFPKLLNPFLTFLQLGRLFDLFIVAGILFLITITYINFIFIQKLKQKLEKIVQEKALNDKE